MPLEAIESLTDAQLESIYFRLPNPSELHGDAQGRAGLVSGDIRDVQPEAYEDQLRELGLGEHLAEVRQYMAELSGGMFPEPIPVIEAKDTTEE